MRKETLEDFKEAIASTKSMTAAAKSLGMSYDTFKRKATRYGIWKTNQSGAGIDKATKYKSVEDVFIYGRVPRQTIRKWLIITGTPWECEICKITEWMDKPVVFEVDHIDGDNQNNLRHNLRLLCPTCHSQTDTFKNRGATKEVVEDSLVDDSALLVSLKQERNMRQALFNVGLTDSKGNYDRAFKLLQEQIAPVDELVQSIG